MFIVYSILLMVWFIYTHAFMSYFINLLSCDIIYIYMEHTHRMVPKCALVEVVRYKWTILYCVLKKPKWWNKCKIIFKKANYVGMSIKLPIVL